MSKKRKSSSSSSLFAAISKLETDDARAAKSRRLATATTAARSRAARAQAGLSGDLVECRILMQRAVGEASSGGLGKGDDPDLLLSADKLLAKLLEARRMLCLGSGEDIDYSDLVSNDSNTSKGDDSSSSDNDESSDEKHDHEPSSLESTLRSEYESCRSEWKTVFNRRHHDLRLHSGLTAKTASKFKVMEQNFWDQVENTVAHERLVHSNRTNRRERDEDGADLGGKTNGGDSPPPIFDDSKVYQHMLRDFVALGASAGSAGGGAGSGAGLAADAAAERLRRAAQKKKGASKEVDRRASKGRKIRYAVNPKLENFTFPLSRPVTAISEDDWFRSLFGGAGRK